VKEAAENGSDAKLAGEVNRLLAATRTAMSPRDAADLIQGMLDRKALNELMDDDGNSCRSVAVAQLLALGFPYALEVSPADLTHHRIAERNYGVFAKAILLTAMACVIAAPAVMLVPQMGDKDVLFFGLPFAAAYSGTALAALASVWRNKPVSRKARLGRFLLRAAGVIGLSTFIGVWLGAPVPWASAAVPMFWAGAAALAAPMFLSPPAEPESEDDA
jgi:hypothetical protein